MNLIKPQGGCPHFKDSLPVKATFSQELWWSECKSCLFTLALLIVYYIFSMQACDVPAPTKLRKVAMNNTAFETESQSKHFNGNSRDRQTWCEHLTCSLSRHCLCICHVIKLFTTMEAVTNQEGAWLEANVYWMATQETDKIINWTLSETFVKCSGPWLLNQVWAGVCDYKGAAEGNLLFSFFPFLSFSWKPQEVKNTSMSSHCTWPASCLAAGCFVCVHVFHHNVPICICFQFVLM